MVARPSHDAKMRAMPRSFAVVLALAAALPAQQTAAPRTVPEASGHTATSRLADVERFVAACRALPHGDRLQVRELGRSHADRALTAVHVRTGAGRPLRALLLGNIHGGEVEGKEALQLVLRECALGEHGELLAHVELCCVPVYNPDGNEAMAAGNRPGQNGPFPIGERANAQGLDLNRDLVKVEAPETRVLLQLFRDFDPHLFVDLHTTNGSFHGFHLTYAPSLSPNVDPALAHATRTLLDDATVALASAGFAAFDYGNFEQRPERGYYTYDHRARYAVNYFGLRNRIGVLSEAYSYDDFATRIAATRTFVLGLLHALVAQREPVLAACATADRLVTAPELQVWFGSETTFAPAVVEAVQQSEVERVEADGARPMHFVRRAPTGSERMPVVRAFRAERWRVLPQGWALPDPEPDVLDRLVSHGVEHHRLAAPTRVQARTFVVERRRKPKRPYQGHQELVLEGAWQPAAMFELPAGTLVVPARQRLARVAATLLEPESEDSLSTWNFLEARTTDRYPVLRLDQAPPPPSLPAEQPQRQRER